MINLTEVRIAIGTDSELTPEEAARAAERYEKIDKVKQQNTARAAKHAEGEK
ncbi:MAG: hypothetical protein PHR16_17650 [Methylovulum sp.]|nr:hypothetical protein [Methylovulum sp.]